MSRRLRVSHVVVQTVLVWDDGDELAPGPVAEPVSVPLSALAGLGQQIAAEVAQVESAADHREVRPSGLVDR